MSFKVIRNVVGVSVALLMGYCAHKQVNDVERQLGRSSTEHSNPWAKTE
jgi:hypothetical protein